MGTQIGSAVIDLKLAGAGAVASGLDNIGNKATGTGRKISQALGRAALAATAALAGGLTISLKAAAEQEKQEQKLISVLKATGNAAGFSAKQLAEHAAQLQQATTFADENIISTQAVLATFRNIKGDQFKEATEAILDMSVVLEQDAKQGAIQLGKALNDPIRGVTALQRVGITFTDAQREQIKQFQETNQLAKAQGVILEELRMQFGGAARGEAKTFSGQMKQIKNSLGDIAEVIGFQVMKEFEGLFDGLGGIAKALDDSQSRVRQFVAAFADGFKIIVNSVQAGALQIVKFGEDIRAMAESILSGDFNFEQSDYSKALEQVIKEKSDRVRSLVEDFGRTPEARQLPTEVAAPGPGGGDLGAGSKSKKGKQAGGGAIAVPALFNKIQGVLNPTKDLTADAVQQLRNEQSRANEEAKKSRNKLVKNTEALVMKIEQMTAARYVK